MVKRGEISASFCNFEYYTREELDKAYEEYLKCQRVA